MSCTPRQLMVLRFFNKLEHAETKNLASAWITEHYEDPLNLIAWELYKDKYNAHNLSTYEDALRVPIGNWKYYYQLAEQGQIPSRFRVQDLQIERLQRRLDELNVAYTPFGDAVEDKLDRYAAEHYINDLEAMLEEFKAIVEDAYDKRVVEPAEYDHTPWRSLGWHKPTKVNVRQLLVKHGMKVADSESKFYAAYLADFPERKINPDPPAKEEKKKKGPDYKGLCICAAIIVIVAYLLNR